MKENEIMKPWYQSKVVWLNVIATLAAVLDALKLLSIPAEWLAIGATVVAVGNVVLRIWFTDVPIGSKSEPDKTVTWVKPGQGMVEYALILVLVAVVVIAALTIMGPLVKNVFETINSSISVSGATPIP